MKTTRPTVFILSVSSDIGIVLAQRYLKDNFRVIGTYRTFSDRLLPLQKEKLCTLITFDITDPSALKNLREKLIRLKFNWETFISCVGEPRPLTPFFKTDFDNWSTSVSLNSTLQLRVLHTLYPLRSKEKICNVVFFAAGGINKAVVDFSAYTIGKIMLVKMCEYLDAEEKSLNIFTVGPGWTKTKTHTLILNDPGVSKEKKRATLEFLKKGKDTDIGYIYDCIRFLSKMGKETASGRNFSIVYDPLDVKNRRRLAESLKKDRNMYKLRRYGSDL
jgi:short-subunit dehydrogenase